MTPLELRTLLGDETLILRLTSSAPPLVSQISQKVDRYGRVHFEVDYAEEEEPARIGQSISGPMLSLIGGVIGVHDSALCPDCQKNPLLAEQHTNYGPRHPVRRALQDWERTCRRRHRSGASPLSQWRDHEDHPALCADLLRAAGEGVSLLWCSDTWDIPYMRAWRLREAGFRYVHEFLERTAPHLLGEPDLAKKHDPEKCEDCRQAEAEDAMQVREGA